MNLENLLDYVVFSIRGFEVKLSILLMALFILVALVVLQRVVIKRVLPNILRGQEVTEEQIRKLKSSFNIAWLILLILGLWYSTGIDLNFESIADVDLNVPNDEGSDVPQRQYIRLTLTTLLASFFIWRLAKLVLLVFDTISLERYFIRNKLDGTPQHLPERVKVSERNRARRNFRYFIHTLAVLLIISILDIDFRLVTFNIREHSFTLRVSNIISGILIFLLARIIIWVGVRLFLRSVFDKQKVDSGSQFAINQLFTYIVYFISLLLILNVMGMNPTVLAGSAAALLLGVGLGLQQTFNDFFSGILLLFERTVEVGDVVEVGGLVGTVRRIGLRTSQVQTLDNLTVIVPNSKLVTNSVTNWSHTDYMARFSVGVGVAYGSDTEKVKALLLEVTKDHDKIMNFPSPFVRFTNFGDSSLDFEVFFWSSDLVPIENTKSDLRFEIDKKFRENDIEIPFPQRDVWIKKDPS